jgi:hypothetical protein
MDPLLENLSNAVEDEDGSVKNIFERVIAKIKGTPSVDHPADVFIGELSEFMEIDETARAVLKQIFIAHYREAPPATVNPAPSQRREKHSSKQKVVCPLCRAINHVDKNQPKIRGIDVKCTVCLDRNVQIFLPNCGHVCLCAGCFQKLVKTN